MKKFLCAIVAVTAMFFAADKASAQIGHFGVVGGMTFSKANLDEVKNMNYTGFHAGVTYQLKLPLGFSIQPELLYQQRGTRYSAAADLVNGKMSVGFIELPVNIQWGPDLVLFRPYLELSPYVGYAVMNKYTIGNQSYRQQWDGMDRWEYGIGLGVGVEIWKFQLSGKYCWSFGSNMPNGKSDMFRDGKFGGFELSLAVLF